MFRLGLFSGVRPTRRLWLPAIGLVVVSGMFLAPPICRAGALFQLDRVTPYAMPIAPGSSATYILRITNIGDAAAIAPPYAVFYYKTSTIPPPIRSSNPAIRDAARCLWMRLTPVHGNTARRWKPLRWHRTIRSNAT